MVIYNLKCENSHKFEGWFDNLEDYNNQKEKGLLVCPLCNSGNIEKCITKPNIGSKKEQKTEIRDDSLIEKTLRYIEKNFENVGESFSKEAIKIYLKEAEARNIRGTMTPEEEKALIEEGIQFFKIPLPKLDS